MGKQVTIKGAGAFIVPDGSDVARPVGHGATVTIDDALADQFVADGVAVYGDSLPVEPAPATIEEAQAEGEPEVRESRPVSKRRPRSR